MRMTRIIDKRQLKRLVGFGVALLILLVIVCAQGIGRILCPLDPALDNP